MKIRLTVGRGKSVEEFEVSDDADVNEIAEKMYRKSTPHLMSRDVEARWDGKAKRGVVYAGFHVVGEAVVV